MGKNLQRYKKNFELNKIDISGLEADSIFNLLQMNLLTANKNYNGVIFLLLKFREINVLNPINMNKGLSPSKLLPPFIVNYGITEQLINKYILIPIFKILCLSNNHFIIQARGMV